jgi:hypothetical protein
MFLLPEANAELPLFVIPAKAGTQLQFPAHSRADRVPAFAGMTRVKEGSALSGKATLSLCKATVLRDTMVTATIRTIRCR